jgi:hypothetical protein
MQDAFKYFERMAQLVAQDPVTGAAPPAARRHPDGRGLSELIRIVRSRRRAPETKKTATVAAINDAAADGSDKKVRQAA